MQGESLPLPVGADGLSIGDLIDRRLAHSVFQPIFDLSQGRHFACEALLRGPQGSALHGADALFAAASAAGRRFDLEWLGVETALASFAAQKSALRLFLNLSIGCLHASRHRLRDVRRELLRLGIAPSRIVVEITENQSVTDFKDLQELLREVRQAGIQFAMDDLGEGFSNLRMWSDVRPEFVKIDRHFIQGIEGDTLKLHFVRAMHEIADACGSALIAEGVESAEQISVLRRLGIGYLQGYAIARPHRDIAAASAASPAVEMGGGVLVLPPPARSEPRKPPVGSLAHDVPPVAPETDNDSVFRMFERDPTLIALPVVADGRPLGVITRSALIDRFARPFRRELYGRRSCAMVMDPPQLFEEGTSAQDVARAIGQLRGTQLGECFIITRRGRYAGIGNLRELMALITDLQIRAARYANPLTLLPGNVPINEHLDDLIECRRPFVAAYCDLDHFKPFNDAFGYLCGDQMIQLVGRLLSEAAADHDDFVGHIGGDDFVILLQSPDWERRLRGVLARFDASLPQYVAANVIAAGGYQGEDRRGRPVFHALPTLSIGCVRVSPDDFGSQHEVSAALVEAKHQAKRIAGSVLFIERRSRSSGTTDTTAGSHTANLQSVEP
jgi:EAL domain-containing protein (putative c-di-GMP-specific phosphodiesterase class I)/GGDEF domain-containing protein